MTPHTENIVFQSSIGLSIMPNLLLHSEVVLLRFCGLYVSISCTLISPLGSNSLISCMFNAWCYFHISFKSLYHLWEPVLQMYVDQTIGILSIPASAAFTFKSKLR